MTTAIQPSLPPVLHHTPVVPVEPCDTPPPMSDLSYPLPETADRPQSFRIGP